MSRCCLALLFLAPVTFAGEPDFRVEDAALRAPPRDIVAAVVAAQDSPYTDYDGNRCSYEGKTVDLDGDGKATDWVLTSKDACSWAASAAPIWVVRRDGVQPRVVLQFMSYSLTVGTAKAHGLRHIATARMTAARTEEQLWKYDGQAYQITRNRVSPDQ